jgi:hypothetical protein
MLMVAGLRLFTSLLNPQPIPAHARFSLLAITLLVTCAVTCAVTWKLSAAGLSLAFWLLAAFAWSTTPHPRRLLTLALAALASSLLITPWLVRGIILSGYPLFPSPALPFDVDWRVPLDHTRATHAWVVQYARDATIRPDALAAGFDWVPRWFRSLPAAGPAKSLFPLLLALAALALRLTHTRSRPLFPGRSNLFFLALSLAAAFWFLTAPAPRFGAHILWLFAGGLLSCVVIANPTPPTARARLLLLLGVLAWIIPTIGIRTVVVFRAQGAIAAGRTLFIGPGADHGLHPTPTQEHTLRRTTSGDEVWVPVDSDMSWDGPLPMTPFFSPNLQWRKPGDVSAGFRAGPGPWQPEIWPHYGSNFLSLWRQKLGLEPTGPAQTTPPGTTRLVAPRRPLVQK